MLCYQYTKVPYAIIQVYKIALLFCRGHYDQLPPPPRNNLPPRIGILICNYPVLCNCLLANGISDIVTNIIISWRDFQQLRNTIINQAHAYCDTIETEEQQLKTAPKTKQLLGMRNIYLFVMTGSVTTACFTSTTNISRDNMTQVFCE